VSRAIAETHFLALRSRKATADYVPKKSPYLDQTLTGRRQLSCAIEATMAATLVIIGNTHRREFSKFALWLCAQRSLKVVAEFAAIADAFVDNGQTLADADITIVLQSWSDQYPKQEADRLIGQTLFHRLICCYGPWCESDGRNRDVWPDAVRVSLRLAESVLEREFERIAADEPAIPPTAARDEIFAYRLGEPGDWKPITGLQELNGAIIGADKVLRKTLSMLLSDLGMRSLSLPLIRDDIQQPVRPKETSTGPVHVVLHDLDPWGPNVEASVNAARRMFPAADILGIATMPDAGLTTEIADEQLRVVIPKLDLENGLRWHLGQLLQQI